MNSSQLEDLLNALELPDSADVPLTAEAKKLLKEYGLYDESADSPKDTETDRPVAE